LWLLFLVHSGHAQPTISPVLRAKAAPDECYKGLGLNGPPPLARPPCTPPAIPKVSEGYVWSLAVKGDDVWFGTTANPLCLGESWSVLVNFPYETDSWACEFGQSPFSTAYINVLPPAAGDYRPPSIYVYNRSTQTLTNLTPEILKVSVTTGTLGLRAATIVGDLVLFAGPVLGTTGINVFAFQASTKKFLGVRTFLRYNNIRRFVYANGSLYAAVGKTGGGGAILRWTGSLSVPLCVSCFAFYEVGQLDSNAADIVYHNGRLYATTWPDDPAQGILGGLWMSAPLHSEGGLSSSDVNKWTKVWSVDQYEPDPIVASTYGGGALASYGGYLFWGTMHEAWMATAQWIQKYGLPTAPLQQAALITGTFRATALFRGKDLDTPTPTIDVLYGNARLPVYVPPQGTTAGQWTLQSNKMPAGHTTPLFGIMGFGYIYNAYTWSMAVWNNRLWVGTMDWSYLATKGAAVLFGLAVPVANPANFGGDLWSFSSPTSPAHVESLAGVGNQTNYGIRNMFAADTLFLGTANGMNLMTDPSGPLGGWEVIEVLPAAGP